MFKITSKRDIWKVTFWLTLAIVVSLSCLSMLVYPRSEWAFELLFVWTMTPTVCVLTMSVIFRQSLKVHELNEELSHLVSRDRLTDVSTRDHFFKRLIEEPDGYGVSLMVDIDFFKKVNDTYGHLAGDAVIKHVAQILRRETRPNDLVCRFGGEEFVIFLMHADLTKGMDIAERLRLAIESSPIDEDGTRIGVTVSIGGSLRGATEKIDQAIKRADEALYRAKEAGRNKTFMF